MRPSYMTLAGALTMRSAPAVLEIAGKQIETDVLTTFGGPTRMLLGFQVLRQLNIALLGNPHASWRLCEEHAEGFVEPERHILRNLTVNLTQILVQVLSYAA